QFNIPKAQADKVFDEVTTALMELAGNIDAEELVILGHHYEEQEMAESRDDSDDDEEDENLEDWVDERVTMTVEQLAALDKAVQPVRLMLIKLHKTAFTIKNSSTIILPRWYEVLEELKLDARMMLWDVSTRWNSTFDMLKFAIKYRTAIDAITAKCSMRL
ncbi:hypothetical protein L208DRAFT_1020696, partial [Tricholoma matsutake]